MKLSPSEQRFLTSILPWSAYASRLEHLRKIGCPVHTSVRLATPTNPKPIARILISSNNILIICNVSPLRESGQGGKRSEGAF